MNTSACFSHYLKSPKSVRYITPLPVRGRKGCLSYRPRPAPPGGVWLLPDLRWLGGYLECWPSHESHLNRCTWDRAGGRRSWANRFKFNSSKCLFSCWNQRKQLMPGMNEISVKCAALSAAVRGGNSGLVSLQASLSLDFLTQMTLRCPDLAWLFLSSRRWLALSCPPHMWCLFHIS